MSFNRFQDAYKSLDGKANNYAQILQNPYVSAVLHIIFIGYASKFATQIPVQYHWIVLNPLFRVAILSLVLWSSSKNQGFAFSLMAAYVTLLYFLGKRYEGFTGFETAIYPGCTNLTVADLLDAFQGSRESLTQAMQTSLVPFNIIISDDTAPLIGTYLMNNNYKLKTPCAPPGTQ